MIDEAKSMQSTNRREICPQCGTNSDYQTTCCSRLEAALRVVRAAESLVFARYGIGIPLTRDPDVLGKSFDTIQAMFVPLQEALIPFRSEEKRR